MPNKNEKEMLEQQEKVESAPVVESENKEQPQVENVETQPQQSEPQAEQEKGEQPTIANESKEDQAQVEGFRSVDDYLLKEDFDKMLNDKIGALTSKIEALIGKTTQLEADNKKLADEKAQLESEKAAAQSEVNDLKDKYENNAFGNVSHGGIINPSDKQTQYESFADFAKKNFNP